MDRLDQQAEVELEGKAEERYPIFLLFIQAFSSLHAV